MITVEENGKRYEIDEKTGLVREASVVPEVDETEYADELRINDRVEVGGKTGSIVSLTASIYGGAYGVHFDDGTVEEYGPQAIKHTSVEAPTHNDPYSGLRGRFESYQQLPVYTNDEINLKEKEARYLNLHAKALASDSKLTLDDLRELGQIVLITGNDLIDLKTARETSEETTEYVARFNRYQISDRVNGFGPMLGHKGTDDSSWLNDAMDEMEVVETTEVDLATRAAEMVSTFTRAQLEDDEFMQVASSYHLGYLQMTDEQAKKFNSYLTRARTERIAELPSETSKQASVEDLEDFDASALYL